MNRRERSGRPRREDEAMRLAVEGALAPLSLEAVAVRVVDGVVRLIGRVAEPHTRREAEARARQVPGVGRVINEIQVVEVEALEPSLSVSGDLTDVDSLALHEPRERQGPEPDFTDDVGASFMGDSVDEAEPYFPPTDTVVKPRPRTDEGIGWVGGFADSAMAKPLEPQGHPERFQREDSEIADDVMLALEEDTLTTDLDIHVHVRRGVVYLRGVVSTLDEAEAAEAVASAVPGVVEVREELQLG